ncbi:MAG: DNA methyltransferase [candidate division WOR-3 bacterium]
MPQTLHRVIIGDAREMSEIPDNAVHLIITSPPYWHIKDYGIPGQIGHGQSYEEYINDLNMVWAECARVLHPGCRICVNIGDQFARTEEYGRYAVIPIREEILRFMLALGFDHMGTIIWQKRTTMKTSGGASLMGSFPYPRNGILEIDYEFILIFRKPGKAPSPTPEQKSGARLSKTEWKEFFSGHWSFPGEKQRGHIAMFPLELPRRLIRMFSFPGETVLDPFLGSGTTALAAAALGRNSLGYEINPDYIPIIQKKLSYIGGFDGQLEILRKEPKPFDRGAALSRLPYIYKDPQGFRKLSDFRREEPEYFRIGEILSPERMILSDGRTIRLIGVKERPEKRSEALDFLIKKTGGQRVFIKEDPALPPENEITPVYLYLWNRTFINAHLIKRGLAVVDEAQDFRHKERFLRYQREALRRNGF